MWRASANTGDEIASAIATASLGWTRPRRIATSAETRPRRNTSSSCTPAPHAETTEPNAPPEAEHVLEHERDRRAERERVDRRLRGSPAARRRARAWPTGPCAGSRSGKRAASAAWSSTYSARLSSSAYSARVTTSAPSTWPVKITPSSYASSSGKISTRLAPRSPRPVVAVIAGEVSTSSGGRGRLHRRAHGRGDRAIGRRDSAAPPPPRRRR